MKLLTKYQTNDGKEFLTREEAENYIVDVICTEIDGIIKKNHVDIRFRELQKLVLALCGSYSQCISRQRFLNALIGFEPYIVEDEKDGE